MNILSRFRLGVVLILLFAVACATTNDAQRKKQAVATRNLGEAYLMEQNYTLALKEFFKAESLNPDDPYLQNDIGLAFYYKEKYDEAILHYKKALDLKSDYAPAMNNLGNAYMAQQRWDSAAEYYEKALDSVLYATPQLPLSSLGAIYYEKKDYQRSEKYYREALDIQPKLWPALLGIARTYVAMGRVADAITKLEKATRHYPDSVILYYYLAKAYQLAGDNRKAKGAYQRVIQLAPESALADDARAALQQLN
jgi:Tfp pilus assembly protein PilF